MLPVLNNITKNRYEVKCRDDFIQLTVSVVDVFHLVLFFLSRLSFLDLDLYILILFFNTVFIIITIITIFAYCYTHGRELYSCSVFITKTINVVDISLMSFIALLILYDNTRMITQYTCTYYLL